MKRITVIIATLLSVASSLDARNSFGIFVDSVTYGKCRTQIEAYRKSVCDDGLNAYVISSDWQSPEQVKDSIALYYKTKALEGVVFIADVPVAMVQGAQHMTTAFKMDEDYDDRFNTSVPSDRFYDDFDLKFDYQGRDSVKTNFFYYRLSPASPQEIHSDIYSARIKPSTMWGDRYEELSAYLEKLVRIKSARGNKFDKFFSYTGDGSFSNSLVAWKDETVTIGEQAPLTKLTADGARFYAFAMTDYPKDVILEELKREDLDFAFFHEHGVPERQYLSGDPGADDLDSYRDLAKMRIRSRVAKTLRWGRSLDELKADLENYGLDSTWFAEGVNPTEADKLADSLADAHTGIMLPDIQALKPNVTMASFDACYNGDFREEDCVAARYIFSGGDCIVTVGNSVNVLQDKSSSDLLGMLAAGYRVGEWMRETNILESHIHGDPTFHFESSFDFENPDPNNTSTKYWKKYLNAKYPCDIQGLALHKLFNLECPGLSDLLLSTYKSSPYYMVRLQCMHLLAFYNDGNYKELLRLGVDDPYEFIRRKSCFYMGKVGSDDLAQDLAAAYMKDYNSLRVAFNVMMQAGHFRDSIFKTALNKEIDAADYLYDKEGFRKEAMTKCSGPIDIADYFKEGIYNTKRSVKGRFNLINGLRNNPYPYMYKDLLGLMENNAEDKVLRVEAAEVLGWYVRAWNRAEIIDALEASRRKGLPAEVDAEALKSINRLKEYMR